MYIASGDPKYCCQRLASLDRGFSVFAVGGGAVGNGLGLVAGGGALELLADGLDIGGAGSGDGGSITKGSQ